MTKRGSSRVSAGCRLERLSMAKIVSGMVSAIGARADGRLHDKKMSGSRASRMCLMRESGKAAGTPGDRRHRSGGRASRPH